MRNFFITTSTFILFIISCNANNNLISQSKHDYETVTFDVVEKKLAIESNLPSNLESKLSKWFENNIKIDGFNGDMIFTVTNFKQKESIINDGRKVDLSLSFEILISKPIDSNTKLIKGDISSYGTLSGNFSLKDFDTIIENTQDDLIYRLSKDLQSKL